MKQESILFYLFLVFFSFPNFLNSEPQSPKEPTLPSFLGESRDARGEKNSGSKESKKMVGISLCDGREVKGSADFSGEGFSFSHTKEGIAYKKKLTWAEIQSVRIETWEMQLKKEDKNGQTYEWVPSRVRIQTKSGEKFWKENGLLDLNLTKIILENSQGTAQLFSYWVDLRYPNGTWFSGLPVLKKDQQTREDCLKDVIRMVEWETAN